MRRGSWPDVLSGVLVFSLALDLAAAASPAPPGCLDAPRAGPPSAGTAANAPPHPTSIVVIDDETALRLGRRIWQNEGGGRDDRLIWWNEGEAFASLGIGHFIWYPSGTTGPFRESFPALGRYLLAAGVALPGWLKEALDSGNPWPSRDALLAARTSGPYAELHRVLRSTVALQARFIAAGLGPARQRIHQALCVGARSRVEAHFQTLAATPEGLYALVDYLNFKGDGTHPGERYRGQGWGLAQVLLEMEDAASPLPPLTRFTHAAQRVLAQRVARSPPERAEKRWLAGWLTRVESYRRPSLKLETDMPLRQQKDVVEP